MLKLRMWKEASSKTHAEILANVQILKAVFFLLHILILFSYFLLSSPLFPGMEDIYIFDKLCRYYFNKNNVLFYVFYFAIYLILWHGGHATISITYFTIYSSFHTSFQLMIINDLLSKLTEIETTKNVENVKYQKKVRNILIRCFKYYLATQK